MNRTIKKILTIIIGLLILMGLIYQLMYKNYVSMFQLMVAGLLLVPGVRAAIRTKINIPSIGFMGLVGMLTIAGIVYQTERQELETAKIAEANRLKKVKKDSLVSANKEQEAKGEVSISTKVNEIKEAEGVEQRWNIGEIVVVKNSQPGCITKEALKEFQKLGMARDNLGIERLEQDGLIYELTPGTNLKVIENGFGWVRVRVINGPYYGESFYTIAVD